MEAEAGDLLLFVADKKNVVADAWSTSFKLGKELEIN